MPLIVVSGDPVTGTDTHNLTGQATDTSTGSPVPWVGTGSLTYTGSMTSGLSSFVRVGGAAVAVTTSSSALDPGEAVPRRAGTPGLPVRRSSPTRRSLRPHRHRCRRLW